MHGKYALKFDTACSRHLQTVRACARRCHRRRQCEWRNRGCANLHSLRRCSRGSSGCCFSLVLLATSRTRRGALCRH